MSESLRRVRPAKGPVWGPASGSAKGSASGSAKGPVWGPVRGAVVSIFYATYPPFWPFLGVPYVGETPPLTPPPAYGIKVYVRAYGTSVLCLLPCFHSFTLTGDSVPRYPLGLRHLMGHGLRLFRGI